MRNARVLSLRTDPQAEPRQSVLHHPCLINQTLSSIVNSKVNSVCPAFSCSKISIVRPGVGGVLRGLQGERVRRPNAAKGMDERPRPERTPAA